MNTLLKVAKAVVMVSFLVVVAMPASAGLVRINDDGTVLSTTSEDSHSIKNMRSSSHPYGASNVSLLFGTSPNTAGEDGEKYGKFTEQFLKYMARPLTWPQLVDKVTKETQKSTNGSQKPYLEGDVVSGFVLANLKKTNKMVLVIGNNGTKESPLFNSINDATAISAQFVKLGYNTSTITDATHEQMIASIRAFRSKLTEGSIGVIYYSGRGIAVSGQDYLMATDSQLSKQTAVGVTNIINVKDVLADIRNTSADTILFVLDTCRDNPILPSPSR